MKYDYNVPFAFVLYSQKYCDQTCNTIYDEIKGSDINVSNVYQHLPLALRSNPSYVDVGLQSNPNPSYEFPSAQNPSFNNHFKTPPAEAQGNINQK